MHKCVTRWHSVMREGTTTDEAFQEQCFLWERGASVGADFNLFIFQDPICMVMIVMHVRVVWCLTYSVLPPLQCSSWLLDCWSTPSASTLHWSGPSAGTLTSTTLASVRSAGATCWLSLESCSLSFCPFLPNMHQRSSCPPPLYPRCYSVVKNVFPLLTTLSNVGSASWRDARIPSLKAMLFGKPHSVTTEADTQQTLSSCICYVINSKFI